MVVNSHHEKRQKVIKFKLEGCLCTKWITIVNFVQEGFFLLNIIFECDNPAYYPS